MVRVRTTLILVKGTVPGGRSSLVSPSCAAPGYPTVERSVCAFITCRRDYHALPIGISMTGYPFIVVACITEESQVKHIYLASTHNHTDIRTRQMYIT